MMLSSQVEKLRLEAAACRRQAIALNAKLVLLQADRARIPDACDELHAVRAHLIETTARLDHAIDEVDAISQLELQIAAF